MWGKFTKVQNSYDRQTHLIKVERLSGAKIIISAIKYLFALSPSFLVSHGGAVFLFVGDVNTPQVHYFSSISKFCLRNCLKI